MYRPTRAQLSPLPLGRFDVSGNKPVAVAVLLAMILVLSLGSTASAHVVMNSSGQRGTYYVVDYDTQPGGRCGYGPSGAPTQYVKWIWFLKPEVYARDINASRNQQKVKLTYILQHRKVGSMTKWRTVASKSQTKTAWDDTRAAFNSARVYSPENSHEVWRGLVNLKWMRNGAVEGQVTYRIEWYSVMWEVGDPNYVYNPWCEGSAD